SRRSIAAASLVVALLAPLGAGCSITPSAGTSRVDSGASAGADATRVAAPRAHAALETRYLLFKADQTQLSGAQDDGRYTYLEFTTPIGEHLQFFDQDGRALESAHAGQVAAVQGIHAGVLVQRGERASFASPNPRLAALPRPPFRESADHAQARAALEGLS